MTGKASSVARTIRDVTRSWRTEGGGSGLYVVRSTRRGSEDKVRVGVAGVRGGALEARLARHASPPPRIPTFATHDHQPYAMVVRAWALDGWSPADLTDAETLLYRAFLVRFPRLIAERGDRSLFVVPPGADLTTMLDDVERDLGAMAILR